MLIGAKRSLSCTKIPILTPLEMLWVRCNIAHSSLLIGVCYRPHNSNSSFLSHFSSALNSVVSRFPNSNILLLGNFNYPGINWNNLTSTLNSSESSDCISTCLNLSNAPSSNPQYPPVLKYSSPFSNNCTRKGHVINLLSRP